MFPGRRLWIWAVCGSAFFDIQTNHIYSYSSNLDYCQKTKTILSCLLEGVWTTSFKSPVDVLVHGHAMNFQEEVIIKLFNPTTSGLVFQEPKH